MKKGAQVLIVGNFLSAYGLSRGICEDLDDKLTDSGWKVITTSRKRTRLALFADMLSTAWTRRNEYSVAQIDVFSGHAFFWAEAVCWLLKKMGKSYVITLHGGNLPEFARKWPRRVRRLLQSATVVTSPSSYLQQHMRAYRANIILIPNPLIIDACKFRPRREASPGLVWLRAFHSIYNPSMAPKVLAQLVGDFDDISLIMVGPDKGDGSLQLVQKVSKELGVDNRISFPGAVAKSDVPLWLNKGDIFLNTTNADNTPVSVLEAMACGLCVVSPNIGGIPYLLEDEKDALLVPPDDPQAMASAIRRILTEPGLAERLSFNARKKAEKFDWAVVLPQWEKLLEDLMAQH